LADPDRALYEMVRVLKPGGTIVVVDPDYGTQVMELPDQRLARKVLGFRAHHALRNGTLGHQMAGRFVEAALEHVSVETKTLTVRDPLSLDGVLGLRSWARAASGQGIMDDDEVKRWEDLYDETVAQGKFLWSVTFFITSGRKPAG
jgi:SAM-dependent methyltransferase